MDNKKGKRQTARLFKLPFYLDLEYPELYFSFGGTTRRLPILKKENFRPANESLCVLISKYRVLGKSIFKGSHYSYAGYVICNL